VTVRIPQHECEKVCSVHVIHFDPYEKSMLTEIARNIGDDEEFSYWSASLTPKFKRCRYGFHLLDKNGKVFKSITERGSMPNEIPNADAGLFCLPFVHQSDMNASPKWAKNTIWYQIFPERFCKGKTNRNHPNQKVCLFLEREKKNFIISSEMLVFHFSQTIEFSIEIHLL